MIRLTKVAFSLLLVLAYPAITLGSTISYKIAVNVTAAPHPQSIGSADPSYTFNLLPAVFVGTFDADNTVPGAISNLALIIGGVDIGSRYSVGTNLFDPLTQNLRFVGVAGLGAIIFGNGPRPFGTPPSNYVNAEQDSHVGPVLDPFSGVTQVWVGTFTVTPTSAPETASVILLAIGAMGLVFVSVLRSRTSPR